MHRSTLLSVLTLALGFVSAAPSSPLRPSIIDVKERGIGEEVERQLWRRQLANSVQGMSWTLVETGAASTTTETEPTSMPTSSTATSSSTIQSSSSSAASSSPSLSTTSTPSPSSSLSSSALKARTSAISSSTSSSANPSHPAAANKIEEAQSGNIFSPSNKLFAVGIVVIIAIIVLAIFVFIFIIKRVLHSSRFIDPLDYPEGLPYDSTISKRYSQSSQVGMFDSAPVSPNSSMESYDSTEKGEFKAETTRNEFAILQNSGGGPIMNSINRNPPTSALPPLPLPPPPSARTQPQQPFSNLEPVSTPTPTPRTRTRASPPAPLSLPTSSFSAPAFDSARQTSTIARPPKAEKPLPPATASRSSRPSYISTLPLSPNSSSPPRFTPSPRDQRPSPSPHSLAVVTTASRRVAPPTSASTVRPVPISIPAKPTPSTRYQPHKHSPPKGRESPLREAAFVREQSRRKAVGAGVRPEAGGPTARR